MSRLTPETPNTQATLELLYHISRELATALDLRTVLQRVLFLAMKNVGAASGSIIVVDDFGQPVESALLFGAQVHNETTNQLRVTFERGLAGWVIKNRQGVIIGDTSLDERWYQRESDQADSPTRSAVAAPLLARERLVGVMTIGHPQPGFFSMDHLDLVQTIADQAGIVVLNARLYEESQRQARLMTALAETAAAINATLNQQDVLQRLMEQIGQALRVQAASLALIDQPTGELVFKTATGWVSEQVVGTRLKMGHGIAGWVAQEKRGIIIPDVHKDPRFDPETDKRTGYHTEAIACAPIWFGGQVIGVLEAINPYSGKFDPDALSMLSGIGSLAGTALLHAQLYESLEIAHQRYRDLFEDSIDPILITSWGGHIQEANRQAIEQSHYSAAELRQMNIRNLVQIDALPRTGELPTDQAHTRNYESNLTRQDGSQMPVQVYIRPVMFEGVRNLQWTLRDIAERKHLDRMRDDLASMIYHDLRSPLANVVSSLDVLVTLLPEDTDPTISSIVKIALRSTERIQRLTNSLLDVNRLSAGQTLIEQNPADLARLAGEALEAVEILAQSKQQTIHSELLGGLPLVYVDGDMVRRVLINLLENAVKYSPVNSTIHLRAQAHAEWMHVTVQDNGRGVPRAEQEHIFEKFTRLDMPSSGARGLGLGLTFCRLAVESHGGRIWVESEEGQGARFTFTIPLHRI